MAPRDGFEPPAKRLTEVYQILEFYIKPSDCINAKSLKSILMVDVMIKKFCIIFIGIFLSYPSLAADQNVGKLMRVASLHASCAYLASVAQTQRSGLAQKAEEHMKTFLLFGRYSLEQARKSETKSRELMKDGPILLRWITWGNGNDFGLGMMYESLTDEVYDRELKDSPDLAVSAYYAYQSENCELLQSTL